MSRGFINHLNKQSISTLTGVIILFIFALLVGGFLIWQVKFVGKEIKKIEKIQLPASALQKGITSNGNKIIETEIIRPIVLEMDKIGDEILIANKEICDECINYGKQCKSCFKKVASYFEIKEDLNGDGKEEIIVGLASEIEEPSIVLLNYTGEEYKIVDRVKTGLSIGDMELKKIPNEHYWSIIVETGGGMGTGLYGEEILVYTYLDKKLKLTWRGYTLFEEMNPPAREEENIYRISFIDIDNDGNLEINQRGLERKKEAKWDEEKGDFAPAKEATISIDKYFKWNLKSEQFEEISEE